MKIYCCQFDIQWEDKKANFTKVRNMLTKEGPEPDSLVLLPELFATGFTMNAAELAEPNNSLTEQFLSDTAHRFRVYLLGGMIATGTAGRGRNECAYFSPTGELIARYCKIQPFTMGGEAANYDSGERVLVTSWNNFSLAPFICYDLRFPEVFRRAMRRGANLLTVMANWPVARIQHWVTLLQARAIENQAYVAGVNRCGTDPKLTYNGRSIIVNPTGEIIADAGDGERIISADVSLDFVNTYRAELPFLKDVRTDYDKLVI
jgi:omega-amidase